MDNTMGTLSTTCADLNSSTASVSFTIGDTVQPITTTFIPQPTTYYWPWSSYSYTAYDPRVSGLEAKVETLEKMLAAVLSGRETPKPRRKRSA